MTKNEFEFTLFLMGFVKAGEHYFFDEKGDTRLMQISHKNTEKNTGQHQYEYVYPDHFEIRTTSTNTYKRYKQHRGYQRIINYLQRQELFIGITND